MLELEKTMGKGKDRKDTTIRRLAAVVSLVIHGLLLFWLFQARYTIDTNPFGNEVRPVFIAPADPLFYRKGTEARENGIVSSGPPPAAPAGSPVASAPLDSRRSKPNSSDVSSTDSFPAAASFRLSLPADYLSRLPEGYEFDLIRRPERMRSDGPTREGSGIGSDFNPNRYLEGGAGTPIGLSPSNLRQVSLPSSKVLSSVRADILIPWAGLVVEKVQMNWTPPVSLSASMEFPVRIALEVGSGAQIQALYVLDPSLSPELDQSALDAVRLSVPLPELPPNFPDESFSFILVFSVHE